MTKYKTALLTAFTLSMFAGFTASAATIERAGGAKVIGESTWVSAITYVSDDGERIKITTEHAAAGRALEAGDSFDRLVIAPGSAFSVSNPYSVVEYVKAEFGAGYVEIIKNNGEDDKDHW